MEAVTARARFVALPWLPASRSNERPAVSGCVLRIACVYGAPAHGHQSSHMRACFSIVQFRPLAVLSGKTGEKRVCGARPETLACKQAVWQGSLAALRWLVSHPEHVFEAFSPTLNQKLGPPASPRPKKHLLPQLAFAAHFAAPTPRAHARSRNAAAQQCPQLAHRCA